MKILKMEVIDLSVDDPGTNMKYHKTLKRKFNDLKKFIPFLNYLFDLGLINQYKYGILTDFLKRKHHSTLDEWHLRSCNSYIRRRYEKIRSTMDIPTHILEIFEGGVLIVISDDEDSNLLSPLLISKENENKNAVHKKQNSTFNIEISQMTPVLPNHPKIPIHETEADMIQESVKSEKPHYVQLQNICTDYDNNFDSEKQVIDVL